MVQSWRAAALLFPLLFAVIFIFRDFDALLQSVEVREKLSGLEKLISSSPEEPSKKPSAFKQETLAPKKRTPRQTPVPTFSTPVDLFDEEKVEDQLIKIERKENAKVRDGVDYRLATDRINKLCKKKISESDKSRRQHSWVFELPQYIEECIPNLKDLSKQQRFSTKGVFPKGSQGLSEGNQDPDSTSGKVLRCLALHERINYMAVYFLGYPGASGVYSLASGLKQFVEDTNRTSFYPIFTAERFQQRCKFGKRFLQRSYLTKYVNVHCDFIPDNKTWIKLNVCPHADADQGLDLLSFDLDTFAPFHVFENILQVCRPTLFLVENSGDYDWVTKEDPWHSFEKELYHCSKNNRGDYRVLRDRELSHLALLRDDDRRHVLYRKAFP